MEPIARPQAVTLRELIENCTTSDQLINIFQTIETHPKDFFKEVRCTTFDLLVIRLIQCQDLLSELADEPSRQLIDTYEFPILNWNFVYFMIFPRAECPAYVIARSARAGKNRI